MTKNSYKKEVLNELSKKRTKISLDKSNAENQETNGFLECSCQEHTNNTTLREGNKIFAVILKQDEEWVIKNTTCWQCSVRNVVERITDDVPIAIVEGTLKKSDINNENDAFCIINPKVWEVMMPAK